VTLAAAVLALAAALPAAAQQAPPAGAAPAQPAAPNVRMRGTLDSLTGDTLAMTTRTGEKITVQLQPNWTVRSVIPVKLEDIKTGDFIGASAAKGADGKLVAEAIQYLDPAIRERAQGDLPWDLTPQSLMVNADIGTVVKSANGQLTVKLIHKNATYDMAISPTTPVIRYGQGDKSLLVKGAWLFFSAQKQPNGTYNATTITAETNGVKPPL
jgi:hypothetical protein